MHVRFTPTVFENTQFKIGETLVADFVVPRPNTSFLYIAPKDWEDFGIFENDHLILEKGEYLQSGIYLVRNEYGEDDIIECFPKKLTSMNSIDYLVQSTQILGKLVTIIRKTEGVSSF